MDLLKRIYRYRILCFLFSMLICFGVLSINILNSSLWFDETVEYFVSKSFDGVYSFFPETSSMYDRIVSTYQPPLYNILMHFWLIIFDSELGFRMAGVVTTLIGCMGVYASFSKENYHFADIAMIVYASVRSVAYYAQECAEYNLMLTFVIWTLYFGIEVIKEPKWSTVIAFCLTSVGAVYSQYGATFVILGMFITVLSYLVKKRQSRGFYRLCIGGGGSVILAGIPLFYYFVRAQIDNSISQKINDSKSVLSMLKSIVTGYKNCFVTYFLFGSPEDMEVHKALIAVCIFVGLIVSIVSILKLKDHHTTIVFTMIVVSLIIYTIACESGYYGTDYTLGYGRWGIMFVPLIYMLIAYSFLRLKKENRYKVCYRITIIAVVFYFILNIYGITVNWYKSDCREYTQYLANTIDNDDSCIIVEQNEATNTLFYFNRLNKLHHTDVFICLGDNQIFGVNDDTPQNIERIINDYSSIYYIYHKGSTTLLNTKDTMSKGVACDELFSSATIIEKLEKGMK